MSTFSRLTSITQRQLKDAHIRAQAEANRWIGKTLIWKLDPSNLGNTEKRLKGRKCEVTSAMYRERDGAILVQVKTRRSDGKGFIDNNDMIHRIYRDVDKYFIEVR